jgi:ectoine hydroxylase-related dioxygenase (phytanoyl-CoA dioxygenase family)
LRVGAEAIDFDAIRSVVWRDPLRSACVAALGARVACNLDQCWLRRQYAPANAPPRHRPHAWHQDGALGFDFGADTAPEALAGGLLEMLTCWIALVPCGVDAPGLELVVEPQERVLALLELEAERMHERHPATSLRRPALATGDALLFAGGIVHRTHVSPAMAHDRTRLELRFFAAERIPDRLAADRFTML